MNKGREEILNAIWHIAHKESGWLSKSVQFFELSDEEEKFLADLDEAFHECIKAMEQEWRKTILAMVAQFTREREGENPIWCRKRRLDYLRQQVSQEKDAKKKAKKEAILRAVEDKKSLDPSMIEQARKYPLEALLGDKLRMGRMPCPLHNGKDRNMVVKKGFGFCFVCGGRLDSIGYLMKVRGMSFPGAVEALQ